MAQKSATVAVINSNKVLILRRGPTAKWKPGYYCLPGGKTEGDESLVECAIRELNEETGICLNDQANVVPLTVSYQSKYTKTIFVTKILNPPVNLNWEHDHYEWVTISESFHKKLVPGLPTTIKTLADHGYLN